MRFILGAQKVCGRCAGAREVCRRWVIIGNLKLKAYFELLNPL